MKIWNDSTRITGVYNQNKAVTRTDKTSSVASRKDVVSISNQAKDFQTVMKALKDVPPMREDKVNELAAKYESGKYDVTGSEIADRLVQSTFDRSI